MVEVDIGLRPATLPPITHVGMVDFWVDLLLLVVFMKVFMVIRDMYIGLRPATLLPITMVDNKVPHQGTLRMISLGMGGG